jgi:hypothetical protein
MMPVASRRSSSSFWILECTSGVWLTTIVPLEMRSALAGSASHDSGSTLSRIRPSRVSSVTIRNSRSSISSSDSGTPPEGWMLISRPGKSRTGRIRSRTSYMRSTWPPIISSWVTNLTTPSSTL